MSRFDDYEDWVDSSLAGKRVTRAALRRSWRADALDELDDLGDLYEGLEAVKGVRL